MKNLLKKIKQGINVGTGRIWAHMMVDLTNDGPVTIFIRIKKRILGGAKL